MMRHGYPLSLAVVGVLALAWSASCDGDNCHGEGCDDDGALVGGQGSGASGGGGGNAQTPAEEYCSCMLTSCHDAYHEAFGADDDEAAAEAACLSESANLPVAGMAVQEGNFVECRIHFCEAGRDDESVCGNTIGGVCGGT